MKNELEWNFYLFIFPSSQDIWSKYKLKNSRTTKFLSVCRSLVRVTADHSTGIQLHLMSRRRQEVQPDKCLMTLLYLKIALQGYTIFTVMSDFDANANYYFAVVVLEAVKTPQNLPQPILVAIFVLVVLAWELPVSNRLLQVVGGRLEDALLA